jgi:hypothetical protein
MRRGPVVGLCLLIAGTAASRTAAEERKGPSPSLLSAFRFGFSAQDPWGPESGPGAVVGELLFAKPFTTADLFASYFIPRPHVGASVDSRTNFAYAGLTWSLDLTSRIFVEGSLGGAVHDGSRGPLARPDDRTALGCSPLFRESAAVGVRLSTNWSMVATVEHLSSGNACDPNRGLTNVGARLGYTF